MRRKKVAYSMRFAKAHQAEGTFLENKNFVSESLRHCPTRLCHTIGKALYAIQNSYRGTKCLNLAIMPIV